MEYVIHWGLDMAGAVSFACILRACNDPAHNHKWPMRFIASHKWLTQSVIAAIMAVVIVKAVG